MQQLILRNFSDVNVKYKFYNRGNTEFPEGFANKLQKHVNALEKLKFHPAEVNFLRMKAPFLKESYLKWLEIFQPNASQVFIKQSGGSLDIEVEGPWCQSIYWEIPLLSIISELYFLETNQHADDNYVERASQKFALLKANGVSFADFGLRRRFSATVHEAVLLEMIKHTRGENDLGGFVGTSNVNLAYKHNTRPIGTMAHELPMVIAGLYGFRSANEILLKSWQDEFNGDLGIALTDTFTTKVFLQSFNREHANTFDGVRQDSGSPEEFSGLIIEHYKSLGIDPMTKTIIFSDNLNASRAIEIAKYCEGKIKCSFGIGTNFTNDVGVKPLNIVIKADCAGRKGQPMLPTVKLSDSIGKITGDTATANKAKYLLGIS